MTSILVLLALLSAATLASRGGAVDELLHRASTPLLIVIGVILSPRVLGILPPSVLQGLTAAVEVGGTALGFFIGLRVASRNSDAVSTRVVIVGIATVAASSGVGLVVLLVGRRAGIAEIPPTALLVAPALLIGACLAAVPTGSEQTPPLVRAWARVTQGAALVAAILSLAFATSSPAQALALTFAQAACGALLLLLLPATDGVGRTVTLLGVLALLAGWMHLLELPGAACGLLLGVALARTRVGARSFHNVEKGERPVRVVLTIVVAASLEMTWSQAALGLVIAVAGAALQLGAARGLGLRRAELGTAFASSSTPIAWVAALMVAPAVVSQVPFLPMILVAVAVGDVLAVVIDLVQRRPAAAFGPQPRGTP